MQGKKMKVLQTRRLKNLQAKGEESEGTSFEKDSTKKEVALVQGLRRARARRNRSVAMRSATN